MVAVAHLVDEKPKESDEVVYFATLVVDDERLRPSEHLSAKSTRIGCHFIMPSPQRK